jgi:hypothetical protein
VEECSRSWRWAQLDFTRVNVGPTIVRNQIEEGMEILELVPSPAAF